MSRGPGYTEFKLKLNSATVENLEHHVLILNSTSVTLSDLTPPIRLSRQPSDSAVGDVTLVDDRNDDDPSGRDEDMIDPSSRRSNRRRTRIISSERKKRQEEEEDHDMEESTPWILEDGDAQHTFIGRREGGQQSNYVFFVNQGRDFLVVPASRWYRFNPKPAYRPLTTEEAEAQMAARGKNRLVLAQQLQNSRQVSPISANELGGEDGGSNPKSVPKLKALRETMMNEAQVAASIGQYGQKRTVSPSFLAASGDHRMDEVDYDEVFDDDDGEGDGDGANAAGDEDDPSAPKPVLRLNRPSAKLSAAGKNLSKLVHSLDRKLVDYRVSDDERDPYADPDDIASDDDDDGHLSDASSQRSSTTPTPVNKPPPHLGGEPLMAANRPQPLSRPASLPSLPQQPSANTASTRTVSSSIASPEKKTAKSAKRASTDQVQPQTETRQAASSYSQPSPSTLTLEEIVGLLRNGPVRTKDLIHTLRDRLKHEASKEAFKDIIKRVASVRTGPGDDEKWLELKADYA